MIGKVKITAEPAARYDPTLDPSPAERDWLLRLLKWCRPRLKHPSYQVWLDKYLALGPSEAPADDEPRVVRSSYDDRDDRDELIAALRPFAELADAYDRAYETRVRCRHARAALAKTGAA